MTTLTITQNDAGQRLDRFLRKVLPNTPLSHIYRLVRRKDVKVNKKRVQADYMLAEGDVVSVFIVQGEVMPRNTGADNVSRLKDTVFFKKNFHIVFEDKSILALNKPAGIVVHPGTKYKEGQTLIDLAHSYLGNAGGTSFAPSLIHRLDRDTSGIIIIAKTAQSLRSLTDALRQDQVKKEYIVLVAGKLAQASGKLEHKLMRVANAQRGGKVTVVNNTAAEAKESVTYYKTLEVFKGYTLLSVHLKTGRTHQIRVHFAYNGHPVAGDADYGMENLNKHLENLAGLKRQFLHAARVEFIHPLLRKQVSLVAPLPPDLEHCLCVLRKELEG